jgi:hypothetical protein
MGVPDDFQIKVARLALAAARDHGFALAGGQALIAHGVVDRLTHDIDLFTDLDDGVQAAAEVVATVLRARGLIVDEVPEGDDLGELFDGFERTWSSSRSAATIRRSGCSWCASTGIAARSCWTSARCCTWTT